VPFGPEISWPYGFRQLDSESREVLESAYGAGAVYQQPAFDDYGYGDPGYSDPSYEGPRTPYGPVFGGQGGGSRNARASGDSGSYVGSGSGSYGGSGSHGDSGSLGDPGSFGDAGYRQRDAGLPGYHVPEVRDVPEVRGPARPGGYASPGYQPRNFAPPSGGPDIWPVTGAQEALPGTGPQPVAGPRGAAGFPQSGSAAYPEQWYDNPRLDDRVLDDKRRDPRLEGINYGELRYDDSAPIAPIAPVDPVDPVAPVNPLASGEPGYEPGYSEPLDDESWYQELRRSAPAYPQHSGGPQGAGGPQGPSGPQRRVEPQGHGYGPQPGYPQVPDRSAGFGNSRGDWGGSGPQTPQASAAPQMSAGQMADPGPRSGGQPGPALPPGPAAQGTGFLAAPVGQVGLLTPPSGTRVDALRDSGAFPAVPGASPAAGARPGTAASQVLTAPGASRPGGAPVRPGHGLDGPEITSSWPVQPSTDDLDSYDDFWRDDEDEEYSGLFGDREAEHQRAAAKQAAAKRRSGRRRGGSSDHRLWLGLGGVVVVAAAAIVGVVKFEFPSHTGPVHTMAIPPKIGTYARTVDLEHQADVAALREKVIQMSSGQASHVVSAVYESGNSAAGNNAQIVMFIGGHLANADPAASIASFTQQFKGARVVSAGPQGGEAACVQEGTGANGVGMCVWFDDDSFGELSSPTMNATALASTMRMFRPSVEQVAPK
jgi:hypothetical protein